MQAIGMDNKPSNMQQKLQLVKTYVYDIELKGFIDLIRSDLLQLGLIVYGGESSVQIIPSVQPSLISTSNATTDTSNKMVKNTTRAASSSSSSSESYDSSESSSSSSSSSSSTSSSSSNILALNSNYGWLNYAQFRSLFYLKCDSLLEHESVINLKLFINTTAEWSGPPKAVSRMKRYFMRMIEKQIQQRNKKWIQQLLQFWTSKTNCIPHYGSIFVLTEYQGRPRVSASACFNAITFPSYMAESSRIFEEILSESIKSLKYGFTSY